MSDIPRPEAIKQLRLLKVDIINGLSFVSKTKDKNLSLDSIDTAIKALEQEPISDKYEYHTDHTDCIWYGSDSGCPVTCSQYRDGWNDAMDYIFKNGKGYQPYRHDG